MRPSRAGLLLLGVLVAGGVETGSVDAKNPDSGLRFVAYARGVSMNTQLDLAIPLRTRSGTPLVAEVNSKWNQPRDTGTTPHRGVDLAVPAGTPVYSVLNGWVAYQSGKTPAGRCCVNDTGAVKWEMVIQLDWNRNHRRDDAVYLKYDHLERVGFVRTGAWVTPASQVATSGNEGGTVGAHLHFGLLSPKDPVGNDGQWTSMEPHYRWVADWRAGADLDYISAVRLSTNNVVEATAYVVSGGQRTPLPPDHVVLFHRRSGAAEWSRTVMNPVRNAHNRFGIALDDLGYSAGSRVDWMVRAVRPGLKKEEHPAGFFPPGPRHAHDDPNRVPFHYPHFTATTRR